MESFIFLASLLPLSRLSSWLETGVCGRTEYLLDEVLHLKGNCVQMLACCIWPALHMWIRPAYISPDRNLVLPDEVFLAPRRRTFLMWLYRQSETLRLCLWFLLGLSFSVVRSCCSSASSRCCRNNFVATERGFFKWAVSARRVLLIFLPLPELIGVLYRQPVITNVCRAAKVK